MQRNEVAFKVAAKDIAYLTSGSSSAPRDAFGALVPDISSDVYKYVLFKYIISCPLVLHVDATSHGDKSPRVSSLSTVSQWSR